MIAAGEIFAAWRDAPVCDLDEITGGWPALVLSPHPDDESLGFGGLIAESCARGNGIEVAVLTDGTGSHPNSRNYPAVRLAKLRATETINALTELGVGAEQITFLEAPDTRAPHEGADFDELASRLEGLVRKRGIRNILTSWRYDPHCDHEAAALLAAAVADVTGARLINAPIWGWTLPEDTQLPAPAPIAMRLDISAHLPAKRRAIAAHVSQLTDLIDDSPNGFRLEAKFLALFDRPWEVFLRT